MSIIDNKIAELEEEKRRLEEKKARAAEMIGKKYTLCCAELSMGAYQDQAGIYHDGYVVSKVVETEVYQTIIVPGEFGYGYKIDIYTKDKEGNRYSNGGIGASWYSLDLDGRFFDVDVAVNAIWGPFVKDNKKYVPDGYSHCVEHNYWYKSSCYRCDINARKAIEA